MTIYSNDPLGLALIDYFEGKNHAPLIVHSSIAEDEILPVSYLFRNKAQMPILEQKALEYCRGRVLDIGAGAGSHALELQAKGFQIMAIDLSEGAVSVMRKRGIINVEQINFFDLKNHQFDTLLLLMNGIGLVGTLEGLDIFLQKAKDFLLPGGQIILDSSDILYMFEDDEGAVYLDLNANYYGEVTYQMEYKEQKGESFNWLFVSFDILQDHAESFGYACELLYEDENDQYLARLILKR